jgi:hypothetical protein
MRRYVKIAWYLLDRKRACKPATILLLKGLLSYIKLFVLIRLIQNFKVMLLDVFALRVNTTLGNRTYIRMMR